MSIVSFWNRQPLWRRILIIVVVLLLLKGLTTAFAALELNAAANALRASLDSPLDSTQLAIEAQRLNAAAGRFAAEMRPLSPVVSLAGADGCAAARLIETFSALAPVNDDLAALAAPLAEVAASVGDGHVNIVPFRDAWPPPHYERSLDTLRALQARPRCEGASPRLALYQDAADGLVFGLDLLFNTPWDETLADSSRWLVVLNNSDELRATGGFTTAMADVTVQDGVLSWTFANSYAADDESRLRLYPDPPIPYRNFMRIQVWLFRDANWSPDHPTSAQNAMTLFAAGQPPPEPTGFITVNLSAVETLASVLPPLDVNGEPFNEDTALDRLRALWNEGTAEVQTGDDRKDFILEYATQVAGAARAQMGAADTMRAALALREMLQRRDVMIYTAQPQMAAFISERGWDGAMLQPSGDTLMLVDTNMGYNKVTPRVARHATYMVDLESRQARVDLVYINTNTDAVPCSVVHLHWREEGVTPTYFDRMSGCYWNYARVFAPPDTELLGFQAQDIPGTWLPFMRQPFRGRVDAWREAGRPGWGMMLVVPPTETLEAFVEYQLPEAVIQTEGDVQTYRLFMQKQPGALPSSITVTLRLPDGASLVSATPEPSHIEGREFTFEFWLDSDQSLELRFRQ